MKKEGEHAGESENTPRTLRELEILQQLGLNADLTVNAKVLNITQKRIVVASSREKKRLRVAAQWKEIPREVQERMARHLTLLEAWAACLGGLCLDRSSSVKIGENERLMIHPIRQQFRMRVRAIEPLWHAWVGAARGVNLRTRRFLLTPTQFIMLKQLLIPGVDGTVLEAISDMPKLHIVDFSRRPDHFDPPLTKLPSGISRCRRISMLRLAYCDFKEIPDGVLRLSRLMRLDLSYNRQLKGLPPDMGDRLSKLTSLNIVGCTHVRILPISLLCTLEYNSPPDLTGKETDENRLPLILTRSLFEEGFLDGIISSRKYPKLVASLMLLDAFQNV